MSTPDPASTPGSTLPQEALGAPPGPRSVLFKVLSAALSGGLLVLLFAAIIPKVAEFDSVWDSLAELRPRAIVLMLVLAFAIRAAFRTTATSPPLGARDRVALDVLLVARQQVISNPTTGIAVEGRLVNALCRQGDLAGLIGILDTAAGGAFVHRLSDERLRAPHEPLPIGEVLAAGVQAPVNDVHETALSGRGPLSPRLLNAHVPLNQAANLPLGVAARYHA